MKLKDLNLEELTQITGGSEFSETVMNALGGFFGGWYHAATDEAIRLSEYR